MSTTTVNEKQIKGVEPKHITYVTDQTGRRKDAHVVKEVIHYTDGTRENNLRVIEDYKRPFWVTQPGRRNHRDKKDYEYEANCNRYMSTEINLGRHIADILKDYSGGPRPRIRQLARSPYLYGADISSACILKGEYRERWPEVTSFNSVAGGDIETNVHSEREEIICMSVTSGSKAVLFYLKSWLGDEQDVIARTHAMAEEHIGEVMRERKIKLDVRIVDTPGQIVVGVIQELHKWQPDFFAFWNIDFDLTRMLAALEYEGINPAEVFSDPSIPAQYKYFNYRRGPTQRTTASGKVTSINFEDRWNWATYPASFQMIDSMPVYRTLRLGAGKDPSYSLDYILEKELGTTKLKFDKVSHLKGLRWHEVMQKDYKIEYGIYNLFDSISLELLDEKTNDLALNITSMSKNSEYKYFNSGPKRLCDDMYFWYLRRPNTKIIGTASDEMEDENDSFVVGHENWIVTLPSYMVYHNGLQATEELTDYKSLIYCHVSDQLGPVLA